MQRKNLPHRWVWQVVQSDRPAELADDPMTRSVLEQMREIGG
jgi:hypothetical protein